MVPAYIEYRVKRSSINYRQLLKFKQYVFLICTLVCQVLWTCGLLYAS
jgi:hypothetical protein